MIFLGWIFKLIQYFYSSEGIYQIYLFKSQLSKQFLKLISKTFDLIIVLLLNYSLLSILRQERRLQEGCFGLVFFLSLRNWDFPAFQNTKAYYLRQGAREAQ